MAFLFWLIGCGLAVYGTQLSSTGLTVFCFLGAAAIFVAGWRYHVADLELEIPATPMSERAASAPSDLGLPRAS
jgi:hypothetical protein